MPNRPTGKYNIVVSIDKYTDHAGKEKNVWKTIGELTRWDDGSFSQRLFFMPGVKVYVFEQEPRKEGQTANTTTQPQQTAPAPPQPTGDTAIPPSEPEQTSIDENNEIDVNSIPF